MKTIELKWIEDVNHNVAEDAYNGLKELIATGVFPNIEVECKDDTLYITGEKEILDKAVMKIQKAYAKYGQIMIKEAKNGTSNELRIESFDDNVQDIFNHTLNDYETFKENCKNDKPTNYITTLGKFQYKFNKLKEAASRKDKKIIQNFLTEIDELTESFEEPRLKPFKEINEGYDSYRNRFHQMAEKRKKAAETKRVNTLKLIDTNAIDVYNKFIELGYKPNKAVNWIKQYTGLINDLSAKGETADDIAIKIHRLIADRVYESTEHDLYNEEIKKQLSNPANWGIIEESMTRKQYNAKYDKVALAYARETGMDLDDAYDELMDVDELVNWIEGPYDVDEIVDKLMNESVDNELTKHLGNLKNWGIIEERLDRDTFNKKFNELVQTYADAEDLDLEVAYDLIADNDEIYEYVDSDMTIEDIMDMISSGEIILENKKIDESFVLSPSELKKKLQRVASKWASEKGVKFMEAYDELRKKKSVKDMLDFYSVDEIIDDLKKQKKEVDDELEDAI